MLTENLKRKILIFQANEITEHLIYKRLASVTKNTANRQALEAISAEEARHYDFWKGLTQETPEPDKLKVFFYVFISRIFGITFGIKLMEQGEAGAQKAYSEIKGISPEVEKIVDEEERHEDLLIAMIDEERLKYASSVVLGLNDALVELTGALVGFTIALQNTKLVATVGIITGIAASMSMAASEYLSTKQEDTDKNPLKASVYTGIAYTLTVLLLVLPYFLFKNIFICLGLVITGALFVVFIFTFYISVAKGFSFKKRFLEMAGISLGIACINFIIGLSVKKIFGINV